MALIDITGQRFGRLTVVSRALNAFDGSARWGCVCDCGGSTVSLGSNLRRGSAKSCGCIQRERAADNAAIMGVATFKHGHAAAKSREYGTWAAIKQRCENPAHPQFSNYGARGILVCVRWQSFENFLADMGKKPVGMSIDRIDNNKGYEPTNCRWATYVEQNNNCRTNRIIIYGGEQMTVANAYRESGISTPISTVRTRLCRGWSVEAAIS